MIFTHLPNRVACPFDNKSSPKQQCCSALFTKIEECVGHLAKFHGIALDQPQELRFILDEYLQYLSTAKRSVKSFAEMIDDFDPTVSLDTLGVESLKLDEGKTSIKSDATVRANLHHKKLLEMLRMHQEERHPCLTPFPCAFCKTTHLTTVEDLFAHMYDIHSFNVGDTGNVVNARGLIAKMRSVIGGGSGGSGGTKNEPGFTCLYCEGSFRDAVVLRKHMRKKKHFRLNPRNTQYDEFFIGNYLEPGKGWRERKRETVFEDAVDGTCTQVEVEYDVYSSDEGEEEELGAPSDEWCDEESSQVTQCLFCPHMSCTPLELLKTHMPQSHSFDLSQVAEADKLYDRIKVVNYIRRCAFQSCCWVCGETFDGDLQNSEGKCGDCQARYEPLQQLLIANQDIWNDARYMLPTYDDDPIFFALDYDDSSDDE